MAVDDANTVVLLHMNGSDASTTFTDESGKTWTARGNAQLDTAQKVFGTASGLFDGTTDYIDTPDHADFNLSGTDWTIDFRIRFNAFPANGSKFTIFSQATDASNYMQLEFYNNAGAYLLVLETCTSGSVEVSYSSGGMGSFSTGTWYHLACVQSGSNALYYKDGNREGSDGDTNLTFQNYTGSPRIGAFVDNGYSINGWLDEVRISRVARWTGTTYTVPTSEYAPAGTTYDVTATMAGTSSTTTVGKVSIPYTSTMAGTSSATTVGRVSISFTSTAAGTSSITTVGRNSIPFISTMAGTSALTCAGLRIINFISTQAGSSSATIVGSVLLPFISTMSGNSVLTIVGTTIGGEPTLTQEGYRWRNDDGDEDAATWKADQDTDTTALLYANIRLRFVIDASGAVGNKAFQLEYRRSGTSDQWEKVHE